MFAEKNEKIAIDLCARSGKLTQMGQTQACRHQTFLFVFYGQYDTRDSTQSETGVPYDLHAMP